MNIIQNQGNQKMYSNSDDFAVNSQKTCETYICVIMFCSLNQKKNLKKKMDTLSFKTKLLAEKRFSS